MTNESISGFLNSIAEAKRAFDAEPDYQRRIRNLEDSHEEQRETIAKRELHILGLKQANDELLQKLRSVEAERDGAGFRHLEADDKLQGLLAAMRGFVADGLEVIGAVEGVEQTIIAQNVLKATHDELEKVRWDNAQLESEVNGLKSDMAKAQEQLTRPFAPSEDTSSSSGDTTDPWSPKPEPYNYELPRSVPTLQQGQSATIPTPSGLDHTPQASGPSEMDPTTVPTPSSVSVREVSNASSAERGLTEGQSETDPTPLAVTGPVTDTISTTGSGTLTNTSVAGQSDGPFASRTDTPSVLKETQSEIASSTSAESETFAASPASPPERNRDRSTFFRGRKYYDVTYYVPLHQWLDEGGTEADYHWRPLPSVSRASHQS